MSGGSGVPSLFASTIEDTDKLGQRRFSSANKYVQKDVDLGIVIGDDLKEKLSKRNPGRFELSKNSRATTKVGIGGRRQVGGGRKKGGVDIFALMDSAMETGPTEEAKQKAREEAAAKKAIEEAPILKPKKVVKKKAKSLNPLKSPTKNDGVPALFASSVHGDTSTEKEPAWKTRLKEKSEEKPLETIVSPEKTVVKVKLESKPNVGKARKKGGLDIFGAIDNAMESGPTAEAKERAREEAASKKAIEATPIPQKTPKKKSKSLAPVSSSNVPSLFASPVESTKSGKEPAWKTRMREAQQNIQSDTDQTKAEKQKLSPVVAKTTASSHMTLSDNKIKDKDIKAGISQANEEKQESPPAGERLSASTGDKIIDENVSADVDQTKKTTQKFSPVIDKVPAAITETKSGDKTSDDEFSVSVSDVESDEVDDKADDSPRGTSIKASPAEPPAVAEINVESNLSPRSSSASDTAQNGPRDSPKKSPVKRTPKVNLRASSPKIKSPRTVSSSPLKSPVSETTSSTNLSSAPSSKSPVDGPVSEPVQLEKASPEPVHLKKTPPAMFVDKADSSDESDSSDDQEDNYPSAFKFTATPKTNFYRSSDSDSDSDSSSDDDDIRGTFQLGENGDVTGLPSADIEFSVDDDKETRQFLFQLEDSLVSTHTADWYRDQINETEKRLQASLVNHKLQRAELTKLVDRKKESMGDIFEGKMDVRRRMGAKQEKTFQKAYDEEQKIVESLRKENKRVRGEVNKLPRQILEIKNSIIGLEAANEEIEGHLESLGKFSKKLERDHEKLQASSAKCRDVYLPRYRNELRQRETHIEIETRIKNLYRSCMLKISRSLGDRKRIELREIANDLILETEADVNPKFDPKVLFESDSESDSSSSDDSDSDSSSNDSDSD